jgi:hypothetical protein
MTEILSRSVICDFCSKQLIQNSSYPAVYSLELRPINTNINNTGMTYAVHVKQPDTLHFCNKTCLAKWANNELKGNNDAN